MTAIVAIDGPSGSGKSTVGRLLAARLDADYVDTGAMYRAFALKAMRSGVKPTDGPQIARLLESTTIEITGESVTLDGEDVAGEIRTPDVAEQTSLFALSPVVREWMVARQREIAASRVGITVFEGRDIGSVVFPDAALKVFVTASMEERSRRRASETNRAVSDVLKEMKLRDDRDARRVHSPMTIAEGAVVVDTTDLSAEEIVDRLATLVTERLP